MQRSPSSPGSGRAFFTAQHAWDFARDPLWDQPDPEPEPEDDEQEADDGLGE